MNQKKVFKLSNFSKIFLHFFGTLMTTLEPKEHFVATNKSGRKLMALCGRVVI